MVPVDGGQVWADDSGGAGPAVVMLHPGVGDSTIWDGVLPALEPYRVIRYDVRGYGRSPLATAEYTLLDDLVSVLDHFELDRTVLVGCSMGGATAVDLALAAPQRVASMVLVCPGISGFSWPDEPELEAEEEALLQAGDVAGLTEFGLRLWAAAGHDDAARAQMRSAASAWVNEEAYQRPAGDAFNRLGELSAPTVILVGDLDRPALIASNEEAARRIPGARLVRVPGGDHLLPLRAPEPVAAAILDQLAGPRAR